MKRAAWLGALLLLGCPDAGSGQLAESAPPAEASPSPPDEGCAVTFTKPTRAAFNGQSFQVEFTIHPDPGTVGIILQTPGGESSLDLTPAEGVYGLTVPAPVDGEHTLCVPCDDGCRTWRVDNAPPAAPTGLRRAE